MRFDSSPRQPRAARPHATNVRATVKWYNPTKGFGFAMPDDGSADAFLHASVLADAGHQSLTEGSVIVCDLTLGQKGPQVSAIHSVELADGPAPSAAPRRFGGGGGSDRRSDFSAPSGDPIEGTVKWFNVEKGFGFIAPDQGGKDVFVHIRAVERSGFSSLQEQQRVRITTRSGLKGPEADTIELL